MTTPASPEALAVRLTDNANLNDAWERFELGMEAPAPLVQGEQAALAREAAALIRRLAGEEMQRKARRHAVDLEQCALFVDSPPLAKAMTDAAAFLRTLTTPPTDGDAA